MTDASGTTYYVYDDANRLTQLTIKRLPHYYAVNSSGAWGLSRTETYVYDTQRDYLLEAHYNDGLSGQNVTWGYDDAGTRTTQGCLYDNLNQLVHCGKYNYDHDELGNRVHRINPSNQATDTYSWDCLNRMTAYNNWNYQYRADGMRTLKRNNNSGTVFRYDGQMGMQDVELSGTGLQTWVSTTNYGLGARGVDHMEKTTSSGTGAFSRSTIYMAI